MEGSRGLDDEIEHAWEAFRRRLCAAVEDMPTGGRYEVASALTLQRTAVGVSLVRVDAETTLAEVTRVEGDRQRVETRAYRTGRGAAAHTVRRLRDQLGIPHPSFLRAESNFDELFPYALGLPDRDLVGVDALEPDLPEDSLGDSVGDSVGVTDLTHEPVSTTTGDAVQRVIATIAAHVGTVQVHRGLDQITMLVVEGLDGLPCLGIYVDLEEHYLQMIQTVVVDVTDLRAAHIEASLLSSDSRHVKFVCRGNDIDAVAELDVVDFDAAVFLRTIDRLNAAVCEVTPFIADRTGGTYLL